MQNEDLKLESEVIATIQTQINNSKVVIYIKGKPDAPQCGFSAHAISLLRACNIEFTSIDILENPDLRKILPKYSNWPTFPQLYVNGKLIGGCDIMIDMYNTKELQQIKAD